MRPFLLWVLFLAGCASSTLDLPGGEGTGEENPSGGQGGGEGTEEVPFVEGSNPCASKDNAPGPIVDLPWPSSSNVHFATEGETVRFHWDDGTPRNVLQVALFEGQDAPLGRFSDAGWEHQLKSGPKSLKGRFDWNTGKGPCAYRPGIYFFVDEDNPAGGVVSVALTTEQVSSPHYLPRSCSALSSTTHYQGRYAAWAGRQNCTQYEVNNFTTPAHFDWVEPTFEAVQGDLILFRWSGLHNVIQVHDVNQDAWVPGGIKSGPRTNCVAGPHHLCVNGSAQLGEYLIDTKNHRPGMIHLSDGCAYGCKDCPFECRGADHSETGVNMQYLLKRADQTARSAAGSCCAVDRSKGTACRLIEMYNDYDGMRFDWNVGVRRGDLVRFRWGGTLQIKQVTPLNADGEPSQNAKPGGRSMPAPVECIPGPNWSCVGGNTDDAEFLFDVDKAIKDGAFERFDNGQIYFTFYAFGENTPGFSSADSPIRFYVSDESPYSPNPPCP